MLAHPKKTTADHPLRVRFMMVMIVVGVGLLVLDSQIRAEHGWHSAALWGYGLTGVYVLYVALTRDWVVGAMVGFAFVAGLAELASDAYLVSVTGTLDYPPREPLLWDSPAYMPFSWTVVLTQLGFISYLLMKRFGPWQAGLLLVPVSGLLIPLYEHWAIGSGWWSYTVPPGRAWWNVPYYIFLAEALLVIPVPFFVCRAMAGGWRAVLTGGLLEGVVMLVACLIAFNVVG